LTSSRRAARSLRSQCPRHSPPLLVADSLARLEAAVGAASMAASRFAGSPKDWLIEVTCTSVAGGNAELTPKNTDADAATSIVFNGNARFVVGRDYVIRVDRK
jgi:hypothetical protein